MVCINLFRTDLIESYASEVRWDQEKTSSIFVGSFDEETQQFSIAQIQREWRLMFLL